MYYLSRFKAHSAFCRVLRFLILVICMAQVLRFIPAFIDEYVNDYYAEYKYRGKRKTNSDILIQILVFIALVMLYAIFDPRTKDLLHRYALK